MVKMFMLIVVSVAFFCAYPIVAQSQGPTPGTRKESKPPQQYSPSQQQKAEPYKRGTEQMPFVVKTIPTPKSQAEAEQDRKEHEEKTFQGWWIIGLTGILAIMAIINAIVLCKGLRATQLAANAAKQSADALNAAERAYVFSNIKINKEINLEDKEFYAILYLRNDGKTPAIITEIGFMGYSPNVPCKPLHIHQPIDSIIGSNDEVKEDRFWFHIKESDWQTLITTNPQVKFFCIGYVKYITIFGEKDCNPFYWEFYAPDLRFILVQSEKLNHDT
jgi:hypothetical protein